MLPIILVLYALLRQFASPRSSVLALVRSCLGLFPIVVPTFLFSIFLTLSQLFWFLLLPLAVPMREVPCVGYTLCAWDLRSPWSILDVLYFSIRISLYVRSVGWVDHNNNSKIQLDACPIPCLIHLCTLLIFFALRGHRLGYRSS